MDGDAGMAGPGGMGMQDVQGIKWDTPAAPAASMLPEVETELVRLATMNPIEYDQCRADTAATLGIRVSTLDEQVQARRPVPEAATGRGVSLPQPDPWPSPVGGAELLDGLAAAIRRHIILRPAAAEAVALWIAHTWVAERFQHTPRLSITSPAKRCGKSTLLDVLNATSCKPLKADSISAAGTFRTVEALAPLTLLLDEADGFLAENDELRSILNSGFERSGKAIRTVEMNGEWQPVQFRTFAPVALAGIGKLPDTLEDRAVPVALQRKGAAETAVKLRAPGARASLAELASKAARWSTDRGRTLSLHPAVPEAMGDREGDICVPLLSIADDAGGAWPERGRAALLDLFGKRAAEGGTAETGALLLADLRALFRARGAAVSPPVEMVAAVPSADIVAMLGLMEERPWPEWKQGKPITVVQLARALSPFGVRPHNLREGQEVVKGYHTKYLVDAWRRYLPAADVPSADLSAHPTPAPRIASDILSPAASPIRSVTPLQPCSHERIQETKPLQGSGRSELKTGNSYTDQPCSGVADQK